MVGKSPNGCWRKIPRRWSRAFTLDLRGGVVASTTDRAGVLTGFVRCGRTEAFGATAGATQVSLRLSEPGPRQGPAQAKLADDPDRFQSPYP